MRWYYTLGFLVLAIVLQLAVADLGLLPAAPNFVLLYLCASLLFLPLIQVFWLALFSGLMLDMFSGLPDGIMAISLTGSIFLSYYISQMFFTEKLSNFMILFYGMFASILFFLFTAGLLAMVLYLNVYQEMGMKDLFNSLLPAGAIMNLIMIYPAFWVQVLQINLESRFTKKYEPVRS